MDNLSLRAFKERAEALLDPFMLVSNQSWDTKEAPECWKKTIGVMTVIKEDTSKDLETTGLSD